MSEINFTTHLYKAFTEKYGDTLQRFFINDALVGKYLSAGELYHYIYPEARNENIYEQGIKEERKAEGKDKYRISPKQPTFNKNYIWTVNLVNKLLKGKVPVKHSLENFFVGNFVETNAAKNSESSYWENLFVNAWILSQDRYFGCSSVYFDSDKEEIIQAVKKITIEETWYELSIWHNVLWSIELFRLRFFFDSMVDNSFTFVYVLDWIDILEYRIMPKVLAYIKRRMTQKIEEFDALRVYNCFMKEIKNVSEFPYAERYGLNKLQKRNVWHIRKLMLPISSSMSDVNLDEDEEIYSDLVALLKNKIGGNGTSSNVCKHITSIVAARNRYRDKTCVNGVPYQTFCNTERLECMDAEFVDSGLILFAELTVEKDIDDTESIFANLLIYHMIRNELALQEQEDLAHPACRQQKEELEQRYTVYRADILSKIFEAYTDNKELLMAVNIADINDALLSEMLMIGSNLIVKNVSDDVLSKVFQDNPDPMDKERNGFVNQAWGKLGTEDKMLYALFAGEIGKMERIRGYIDDDKLCPEEVEYIGTIAEDWEKEIRKIHELLKFND